MSKNPVFCSLLLFILCFVVLYGNCRKRRIIHLGIDLGTQYSKIGVDGKVELIRDDFNNFEIESIVGFPVDEPVPLVGHIALDQMPNEIERIIFSPQSYVGLKASHQNVEYFQKLRNRHPKNRVNVSDGGFFFDMSHDERTMTFSPEDVCGIILNNLIRSSEKEFGKKAILKATIAYPSYMKSRIGGLISDFELSFIEASVATIFHYWFISSYEDVVWRSCESDGIFMTIDFGGGSLDLTLLRYDKFSQCFEIVLTGGKEHFGGVDFSLFVKEILMKDYMEQTRGYITSFLRLRDPSDPTDEVIILGIAETLTREILKGAGNWKGKKINERLSRGVFDRYYRFKDFEAPFENFLRKFVELLEVFVREYKMIGHYPDIVLLSGGLSNSERIGQIIERLVGLKPLCKDPQNAVALGTTVFSNRLVSFKIKEEQKIEWEGEKEKEEEGNFEDDSNNFTWVLCAASLVFIFFCFGALFLYYGWSSPTVQFSNKKDRFDRKFLKRKGGRRSESMKRSPALPDPPNPSTTQVTEEKEPLSEIVPMKVPMKNVVNPNQGKLRIFEELNEQEQGVEKDDQGVVVDSEFPEEGEEEVQGEVMVKEEDDQISGRKRKRSVDQNLVNYVENKDDEVQVRKRRKVE